MVRLVKLIQYYRDCLRHPFVADRYGTDVQTEGDCLNFKLTYYQIARSIGITYEECVRLFQKLKGIVIYKRGGKIIVKDWNKLELVSKTTQ